MDLGEFAAVVREHFAEDNLGRDLVRLFDAALAKHAESVPVKRGPGRPRKEDNDAKGAEA